MLNLFRQRSPELEHLDKGDYTAEEYEGCIVELQRVNHWLGDARALRKSLLAEVENQKGNSFSVIDVGAGSGELLQVIANWAQRTNRKSQLIGVELNARSAVAIAERGVTTPAIAAIRADSFQLPFRDSSFDYAMCSLFTHHFKNEDVVKILRELNRISRRKIFVIDLHRHPIAYFFFTTFGRLFFRNRLIREDGALSILRSFKPQELSKLADQANLRKAEVSRSFPYRLVLTASRDE